MRLIDANQFEVISWRAQGGREYANGFDDGVDYVVQKIDKAETVEAIPIEWLKAQIKPYTGDVSDIGKSARNGTIKDLIRKWQKEQEAR